MPRFIFIPSGTVVDNDFTFTVKTDNSGTSTNTQFKLPLVISFNGVTANIDWGDGSTDSITAYNQSEVTHTYSTSGTYEIKISSALRGFVFNNGGDKLKILNISNWGIFDFNESGVFNGCTNLNTTSTDTPIITMIDATNTFRNCTSLSNLDVSSWNVSSVTDMFVMFSGCTSLTSLNVSSWDVSNVVDMRFTFVNCTSLSSLSVGSWDVSNVLEMTRLFLNCRVLSTLDVTNWDTSSVTDMSLMFRDCDLFDYSLADWNINNVTNFSSFMNLATGLSTSNYDATLVGWEATLQAEFPSGTGYTPTISIDFGGSQYTSGGTADTARQSLVSNFGWTITDGGSV